MDEMGVILFKNDLIFFRVARLTSRAWGPDIAGLRIF